MEKEEFRIKHLIFFISRMFLVTALSIHAVNNMLVGKESIALLYVIYAVLEISSSLIIRDEFL